MHAPFVFPRLPGASRAGMFLAAVLLAGCGGSHDDEAPISQVVGVAPVQADYDGAVASVDQIATPVGGAVILSAASIIAAQAEFDTIADKLLNL